MTNKVYRLLNDGDVWKIGDEYQFCHDGHWFKFGYDDLPTEFHKARRRQLTLDEVAKIKFALMIDTSSNEEIIELYSYLYPTECKYKIAHGIHKRNVTGSNFKYELWCDNDAVVGFNNEQSAIVSVSKSVESNDYSFIFLFNHRGEAYISWSSFNGYS